MYPVVNKKTGEEKDVVMSFEEYDKWREENPDWDRDWTDPENFPYIGKYPRRALISDAIAGPTQAVDIVKELEAPGTERRLQEKDLARDTKGYGGMLSPVDKNYDKGADSSTFKTPDRAS